MAKILVVEDDEFFSEALKDLLVGAEHQVIAADNGKMAIYRLETEEDIECIISDIQMPVMTGLELAQWAIQNRPAIPFILMTGHSEMIATMEALKKGAVNLLYKPFSDDDVISAVARSLSKDQGLKSFAKIPSRSLLHCAQAEFNLYTYDNGALTKVISRGEPFKPKNNILLENRYLYTEKENLERLIPANVMVSKAVIKSPSVNPARKAEVMENCIELMLGKISSLGLDERAYQDSVEFISCFLSVTDNEVIWRMLDRSNAESNPVHISTLVSTAVAVMIGQHLKMSLESQLLLANACLFHDIGKLGLESRLIMSNPSLLSIGERAMLDSHVEIGVSTLRKVGAVPDEVCTIVAQHHENCLGTGYPNKLTRQQIHPLARLISVVDTFCLHVLKSPGHPGIPPEKAVGILQESLENDHEYVDALSRLLKSRTGRASA